MPKIIYQISAGIIGALILGVILGYGLSIYGANNGCFSLIDYIMRDQGYLSCGPFGFFTGAVIGAILGIVLVNKLWKITKK